MVVRGIASRIVICSDYYVSNVLHLHALSCIAGTSDPSPSPLLSAPALNKLNQLVVWRVAAQWYLLGLSLGVEPAVLATVKADRPGDVKEACRDLLCRWLSQGPGTGKQPRVWLSVLTAIRKTVGEMIADEVEREAVPSTHTMSLTPNTSSVPIRQLFGVEPPSLSTVQRLDYPGVALNGELGLSQRGCGGSGVRLCGPQWVKEL